MTELFVSLTQKFLLGPFFAPSLITLITWLTYHYTLKCGSVSDDIAGIMEYDGKLQGTEYGMLWRWVRYHICGGNSKSKHSDGRGGFIPNGKVASHHHFLSIVIFNITCVVTYYALTPIIGSKIALMSVIFLIVHPCTTQGVAWFSGLAYPLSLLWMSILILLTRYFYAHPDMNTAMWLIPTFVIINWLAIHAIFATTAMLWIILMFLGYWQVALLSLVISAIMCFDEIRKIVNLRVTEFKKQHMEQSTVLNWRKPIVALKTFCYYVKHSLAPIRMGLYHEYGFHYEASMERMDKMFVGGLLIFCLSTWAFFITPCVSIKLGILWYIVFLLGFANFITAQQFLTERYVMVSNLGLGMVIATLTQNCTWVYACLIGGYLVRTWTHLPTYDNELRFYQSNVWNFQKSEVALGNLGVTYARIGMENSATDSWTIATQVNPDYDVPWVNIFYQLRTKGFMMINNGDYVGGIKKLQDALPYLQKALTCKVCHFPEQWQREQKELADSIAAPQMILQGELKRLLMLKDSLSNMLMKAKTPQAANDIQLSINNNNSQMQGLVTCMQANNMPVTTPELFNKMNTDMLMDKLTRRK